MSKVTIPFVSSVRGSKNLHYKRDVPADVQPVVKKTRWSESLGTGVMREAAARARALAAEHDRIIAAARQGNPLDSLTPEERAKIDDHGSVDAFLKWREERASEADKAKDDAASMREWAASDGPADDVPDPEWADGEAAGLEAKAERIRNSLARDMALDAKVRPAAAVSTPVLNATLADLKGHDGDVVTPRDIFEAWKKQKKPAGEAQFRISVEVFEKLFGKVPIKQITKAQIREFRDKLASGDRKQITSKKYFSSFKTLMKWACEDGYMEDSPCDGVVWRQEKGKFAEEKTESRRTFTVQEIGRILAAIDAFDRRDPARMDTAWFVRLSLWTGARPEELAQLSADDIVKLNDVHCLRIHDLGSNSVKTRAGVREVPIHHRLVEAGFLDFVELRRKGQRLFSTLKPDGRGRLYSRIAGRWKWLLRKHLDMTDKRLCMYSFRHTFKDSLRLIQTPSYVEDRIMGHATKGREVADGYGRAQIVVLDEWLQKADPLDERRTVTAFNDGESG
jgi:integrase